MSIHALRSYRFETPSQWASTLLRNWTQSDQGLVAPAALIADMLPHTGLVDANSAVAFDAAGRLCWVRPGPLTLVRRSAGSKTLAADPLNVSDREAAQRPLQLVSGERLLWLLLADDSPVTTLIAVDPDTLCTVLRLESKWRISSIAPASGNGIWAVGLQRGQHCLLEISSSGSIREVFALPNDPAPIDVQLAHVAGTASLILLMRYDRDACRESLLMWRLMHLSTVCPKALQASDLQETYRYERRPIPCDSNAPFVPDLVAADCDAQIYVADRNSGEVHAFGLAGDLRARWTGVFTTAQLPVVSLAGGSMLVASGAAGVYALQRDAQRRAQPQSEPSVILTPALVSPDGIETGWSAAELQVALSGQSWLEVEVAHASDRYPSGAAFIESIQELWDDDTMLLEKRVSRLSDRLPWDGTYKHRIHADAWPEDAAIRIPLHEIESTHVWLRITLHQDPAADVARLSELIVRYPNLSLSDYLPAVYQEEEAGAAHLRNLLSVMEAVFGDLDDVIATLPERIDPETAPTAWLNYLLRWLGLPGAAEIGSQRQRRLLQAAPELLRLRGTYAALHSLLSVLVDGEFRLIDVAEQPDVWSLPSQGRVAEGARLGGDTRVFCAPQPGFRVGDSAELGAARLGYTTLQTSTLLARTTGNVQILIALNSGDEDATRAVVSRYLPYFVPAHCRFSLAFVDPDRLPPRNLFSTGELWRGRGPARIGQTLTLGSAVLPPASPAGQRVAMLTRNTILNSGSYLT